VHERGVPTNVGVLNGHAGACMFLVHAVERRKARPTLQKMPLEA
jgi:hypothetical protein